MTSRGFEGCDGLRSRADVDLVDSDPWLTLVGPKEAVAALTCIVSVHSNLFPSCALFSLFGEFFLSPVEVLLQVRAVWDGRSP